MIDILNNHRTVREYSAQKIDSKLLNKLLESACRASNTGNMQTYSIVLTTADELKKQLAPAHFNQPMIINAPVVLTFCADFNRFSAWCKQRKATPGYANFQSFIAAAIDTIIAAQTFCVAAESEGLGICYLGTTTYNAQEIINVLKLPKLVVPITTITVGYPNKLPEQTDRLDLEAIIHNETYAEYSSEQIDEIYFEKENAAFYKQFVKENNKDTLAQVFTDIRYTQSNNEFFSTKFIQVLKTQGFLND